MTTDRRHFLKTSAATGILASAPFIAKAQAANSETIKIGLIGCGGRGTGALTQALKADPNVRLWAMADAFAPRIKSSLGNVSAIPAFASRLEVPAERQFVGLDAYQELIDSGVDLVLIATPPGFRPQHLRAAAVAGKHVFAEKPMAVDMAGVKSVLESAKIADQKKLTIQHGFCWRFAPSTRAAYSKIQSGEIGRVTSSYGTYYGGQVRPFPEGATKPKGMSDVEWQVENWINFEWTSGGPLLEQAIHTVDKIAWTMNDVAPIAAVGLGGKTQGKGPGNVYDNYTIAYEYPNNVFCHVGQRQYKNCFRAVVDRVMGEGGVMTGPSRPSIEDPSGKRVWRYEAKDGEEQNMYQVCHNELFTALRAGKHINSGVYMANSTALAILGREAAHTGQRVTWKELFESSEDMAPDTLTLKDSFELAPVPIPGFDKMG